jgi:hypothetical protein
MMLRLVVLHHTGVDTPHFDLMYESAPGEHLTTLRCPNWPPELGDLLIELSDHRREYLTYEGPVSQNRGTVRRVAAGVVVATPVTLEPATVHLSLTIESPEVRRIDFVMIHVRNKTPDDRPAWQVDQTQFFEE